MTDRTAREVVIVEAQTGQIVNRIDMEGEPMGLAWDPRRERIFVAAYGEMLGPCTNFHH